MLVWVHPCHHCRLALRNGGKKVGVLIQYNIPGRTEPGLSHQPLICTYAYPCRLATSYACVALTSVFVLSVSCLVSGAGLQLGGPGVFLLRAAAARLHLGPGPAGGPVDTRRAGLEPATVGLALADCAGSGGAGGLGVFDVVGCVPALGGGC